MQAALVLDTCGDEGYVAAFPVDGPEAPALSERSLGERATQEELLPAIDAVLQAAGLRLADLKAVAVVLGPGSFTGVRIGLATAKGLCEAAGLPMIGISRLHVLAVAAGGSGWAWLQAGRGDVYAERFTVGESASTDGNGNRGEWPAAVLPLKRAVELAHEGFVTVCEPALAEASLNVVLVEPDALHAALRKTAAAATLRGQWSDVALSDAMYLRVPDAELALRAKQA